MDLKTDRLGLLLDQFDSSRDFLGVRLAGLTDEEYLWEPVPGCWSIRQPAQARSGENAGADGWALDFVRPEPVPAPLTTIAWRLGHLYSGFSQRWDWTFGKKQLRADQIALTPSANEALERFRDLLNRWRASVAQLGDRQLDTVGFGQFPGGLDPRLPFICIIWWTNRELIHHGAEIGVLRDLWTSSRTTSRFAGDTR